MVVERPLQWVPIDSHPTHYFIMFLHFSNRPEQTDTVFFDFFQCIFVIIIIFSYFFIYF